MKVLSLHQPWASLVMLGVKRFETRPGPPAGDMRPEGVRPGIGGCRLNRGETIGIASTQNTDAITADGLTEGGWAYTYMGADGEYQACWCFRSSDEGRRGMTMLTGPGIETMDEGWIMPLGYLLGTVRVVDAYPMIDGELGWTGESDTPQAGVVVDGLRDRLTLFEHDRELVIDDELPYGDWRHGRWALELADPTPTGDRCPQCRGDGGVRGVDDEGADAGWVECWICEGSGACDPVPVSGLQGVWQLTEARLRGVAP